MKHLLRLENLAVALIALGGYWATGASWTLFALLVLAPDIAILAYLFGPRLGAIGYNAAHSFIGVALLVVVGHLLDWGLALPVALVWTFHIALDRALGYGLKYASGFTETHLGPIGKAK
ncbi:DUF4260 domain-containing protein [Rhizobiaceae bacterium BDR2-2]|uniref:DUF4260 domain-containing protein n=1 Tax=Ectorhizobium quercum TaxID=2965071 RepID=A0AAE3SWE7_9HYPH|nr:DUF4260 domain-containing protein [Ectorhizobium quercum]MCX8999305.1 DUF4260 domain-containing protein [Ectorhizobium quercum]